MILTGQRNSTVEIDPRVAKLLSEERADTARVKYRCGATIFAQDDDADYALYIEQGIVKKSHVAKDGKEAVVGIFRPREFIGVSCVAGQTKRDLTATALTGCSLVRIEKSLLVRRIYQEQALAELFISCLIQRTNLYQDSLLHHLSESSERRLARTLLSLAGQEDVVLPKISQETLGQLVGTTRSRINCFMQKFRGLGLIEFNGHIRVHCSLLNSYLREDAPKG